MFLLAALITMILGFWARKEQKKVNEQRNFVVVGGITLALIATILTIISAIVSITVGLYKLFDDQLWWWFH